VPGVHAWATDGVAAIATIAMHATHSMKTKGCRPDSRRANLDPDPLPLPAHSFAQVVHLGADNVVDCLTRAVYILAHRIGDVVHGNRFNQFFSALTSGAIAARRFFARPSGAVATSLGHPFRAWGCAVSRPPRSFESGKCCPLGSFAGCAQYRSYRPAAARPRTKNQSNDRAHCGAKHGRRQQVELLLTIFFRVRLADGRAGAASPTRSRLQCICHPDPPPFRMPGLFPCVLHGWSKRWR
jgi:hypothetical protein